MYLDEWLSRIANIHPVGWDLGLDRVGEVARTLGVTHPGNRVVLIAGTNGKGSTCQYLAEMARAAGYRTGASTSPHLFKFNERIVVDGEAVSDSVIVEAFEQIDTARGDISLTYFEFASLASMVIFDQSDLDLAILEVGLGGRLDAMNVADPDLCVISSIDIDHQAWLGETREAIGQEKAGILRRGIPLVLGDPDPPCSVLRHADSLQVPVLAMNRDFIVEEQLDYALPAASFASARMALELLDIKLPNECYIDIARSSRLTGRKTWFEAGCRVLLDVAHNPAAANFLSKYLRTLRVKGDIHGLIGVHADKDISGITRAFRGQFSSWHLTDMKEQRAAPATEIARHLTDENRGEVYTYAKIDSAIEVLLQIARPDDLVLVFGSFAVVAGALECLNKHQNKPDFRDRGSKT